MAQFPFQHAILKIESKKKERVLRARFSFCLLRPCQSLLPLPRLAQNAVTMVQHAIDAVNEDGQYQAIKYLFEMVGLYPARGDDESPIEDSLVKTLLQHLELPEETPLESGPQGREFTASHPLK